MTDSHAGERPPSDASSDLSPAVISFDGPTRLALTLRLAGYSDDQITKLIDRGFSEETAKERRAA